MMMLRLGGVGEPWLPAVGVLAATLVILLVLARTNADHWRQTVRLLEAHRFEAGLLFVVLLALVLRLPGLNGELGHTPIDMDENRLASNVQHFFVTGELHHETVEHYPGVVFWLFVAGSFIGYVKELSRGLSVRPINSRSSSSWSGHECATFSWARESSPSQARSGDGWSESVRGSSPQ